MASYQLGRTQRDVIREHNIEIELNDNTQKKTVAGEDSHEKMGSEAIEENKTLCWPKCFLLGVGLLILLAGLVSLLYFFKEDGSDAERGSVRPTTVALGDRCEDAYVYLDEKIVIQCTINNGIPGTVEAVYQDLVGAATDDFECEPIKDDNTHVNCTAVEEAKCSSYGNVIISFFDSVLDDKKVEFTKVARVRAPTIFPTATINQMLQDEFELQCSYRGSCTSYEVGFYGRNKRLAETVSCTTEFADEGGYDVTCTAVVSSKVVDELGNGSNLYCEFTQGSSVTKTINLELPSCDDISENNQNCSANTTTLFDCDNLSEITNDCDKTCMLAHECYSARVYEINNTTESITCPKCALRWCREKDTFAIHTSGTISFNHLCNKG